MHITIGELTNEILPYSYKIEMNIINESIPYIKAYLNGLGNISRAIIYIIQTDDHRYSVCDGDNDPLNRYIPTGNITTPFILEKEMIHRWLSENSTDESIKITKGLDLNSFRKYFYKVLYEYEIIRFDPENFKLKMSSMGFTSDKIRRVLNRSFTDNHCKNDSIEELIDSVMYREQTFSLRSLRKRELGCVQGKLRDIGIETVVKDNLITKIEFIRRR